MMSFGGPGPGGVVRQSLDTSAARNRGMRRSLFQDSISDYITGQTRLHRLVRSIDASSFNEDALESCIKAIASPETDVNKQDRGGWTALHFAAKAGPARLIGALVDANADVGAMDTRGRSALHLATRDGNSAATAVLLAHCAPIDSRDSELRTPLHYAVYGGHAKVAKMLVLNGADIQGCDKYDFSPAHAAAIAAQPARILHDAPRSQLTLTLNRRQQHQRRITEFLRMPAGRPELTPSPPPTLDGRADKSISLSPFEIRVEVNNLFLQLNTFWNKQCFRQTWLAQPCRDFILHLILILKRVDESGGPYVPIEMIQAVLFCMRGRDFIIRSSDGILMPS